MSGTGEAPPADVATDPAAEPAPAVPGDTAAAEPSAGADPLADALAEAQVTIESGLGGGNPEGDGPGLTAAEIAALRDAISPCWNIRPLSREARQMTVTVRLTMTPDAVPVADSIRLERSQGGNAAAAQQAFDAARRALIRCAGTGYPLPRDRYNRWREIVVNFHGQGLALR